MQINNEQASDISMFQHQQMISDDRGYQGTAGQWVYFAVHFSM